MSNQIPLDHFSGQRNIAPELGYGDPQDLARLIRGLQGAAGARASSYQATAATAAEVVMIAPAAGFIESVKAVAGAGAAAGESLTVDVKINGTTVLTAAIVLDAAAGTDVKSGTLDSAAIEFAADDLISVERTYVAGGGPTPIVNSLVDVFYTLDTLS